MSEHGLVIGKFYPPHLGHHYLVEEAKKRCTRLSVVVMASTQESIPLEKRVAWMQQEHAGENVSIVGVTDNVPVDYEDSGIWDQHVALIEAALVRDTLQNNLPPTAAPVDVVFTSEPYGTELALRLGAREELVDLTRTTYPVSGTLVRKDPVASWHQLAKSVRRGLAKRVVVLGAESSGTTTTSILLHQALKERGGIFAETAWVQEYGRYFTIDKMEVGAALAQAAGRPAPGMDDLVWTEEDFTYIAKKQQELEDSAAENGPVLVCDTDAFTTSIWHTRYMGARSDLVESMSTSKGDLYLLTDDAGVPFEQDGIRDGEHLRAWMTEEFKNRLDEEGLPWVLLSGSKEERVQTALQAVDNLLDEGWVLADPLG